MTLQTIVILASPLIGARSYRPTVRCLEARHRVIVLELPGSGDSVKVDHSVSIEESACAVSEFLSRLGHAPVALVGHSNSGPVAHEVARTHPDLVSHLILVDTIGADPSRSMLRAFAARAVTAFREPRFTLVALADIARNLLKHPRNFLAQARLSARFKFDPRLAHHPVPPTMIGWGAKDITMRTRSITFLQLMIPHAVTHVDPSGDHDWLSERAPEFSAAVERFLRYA